ncbi:tetratricopeptide repeat protein [Clostridium sp. MB40-C1]|uniref:tetratricopeptide repeat protein n=1 Tax=Clostridium sp. MB40-C1 TaxID=3070996 RepID=UPI0027E14473|nr:tetratricopeptide repeat protein [Clostridium sp. MB40-C1]WMJ80385.1 tetratricopeptide repeat protein [Clostridium sp. MB40-C1]
MDKSNKLYLKALNQYESGYIDNAIATCEESISINMKNRASINLKGLLYYFKGDIEGARALWKLNSQVNNDEVSKKYLQSLNKDEKNLCAYTKAVNYIKQLKIQEALTLLIECSESDYNCINVSNAIATCYIKLGQYDKAISYINKVIKIDKKNEISLQNKKEVIKYGISRKKLESTQSNSLIKKLSIVAILILFVIFIAKFNLKGIKDTAISFKKPKVNANINLNNKKQQIDKVTDTSNKQKKSIETKQEKFPYDDFKKCLDQKDYNKLFNYVSKWKNENLSINDKSLFAKGEELLKNEGVKYFYTNGKDELLLRKDYKKAIDNLLKAYSFGANSYLYQDIIYMIGVSYHNLGDVENALKYFNQYDINYSKGSYEEEVLYRLVVLNKNINLKKSKEYAEKLVSNYPNSDYNNSLVKSLLSN